MIVKQKAISAVRRSKEEERKEYTVVDMRFKSGEVSPNTPPNLTIVTFGTNFYEIPLASAVDDLSGGTCLLLSHVTSVGK